MKTFYLIVIVSFICIPHDATCETNNISGTSHEVIPATGILAEEENLSVTRFREYLRCKAVHPNPDYNSSIAWVKAQAEELGLEYSHVQFENDSSKFAIWLTWRGRNESLKSIFLNSHMDVVPVDIEKWTHDPFGGEKDENGNIYGRGAQDMKSVGVQYLEVIRSLKTQGFVPERNVHVSFVPDEELGGSKGMKLFVQSEEFKGLNIGLGLDEGRARPDDKFSIVWAERAGWQMEFTSEGQAGHGSILHNNTAAEKMYKLIGLFLELRTKEKERMETNGLELGDVTSINLTMMKGGTQANVVPSELTVTFDIRITPLWNHTYVQNLIDNFTTEAGPGVTYKFLDKNEVVAQTPLTPDNPWWVAIQGVANETGLEFVPTISPGGSDARFLRDIGIPAFGLSTMNRTPVLAHDHDEFLNEDVFLQGIIIYERILVKLFNLP